MFSTPRSTRSVKKVSKLESAAKFSREKQSPEKRSFLFQTTNVSIVHKGDFPDFINQREKHHEEFQFGAIDPISGYVVASFGTKSILWNYLDLNIPQRIIELPTTPVGAQYCLHCIVPASNYSRYEESSTGLVIMGSDGSFQYWRNIAKGNEMLEIHIPDIRPMFLIHCDQIGVFVGLENGAVVRVKYDADQKKLSSEFLSRKYLSKVLGFFGGNSDGQSILHSNNECIKAIVPGAINLEEQSGSLYILSTTYLQKWRIPFIGSSELEHEVNISSQICSQLSNVDRVEVLDMDFGKSGKLVFLLRDPRSSSCLLALCEENGTGINLLKTKLILEELSSNEMPEIALSNGGPIGIIKLKDRLIIEYVFDGIEFHEEIPFKKKDLVGCGVDRSKVDMETFDSKSKAAIYCSDTGILEVDVSVSNLMRSVRRKLTAPSEEENTGFYEKLEQAVFFAASGENNPISYDLSHSPGDINYPCIALSDSILNTQNKLLPNTLDETGLLAESTFRIRQITKILIKNRLYGQLSDNSRCHLLFNTEKMVAMKAFWDHQSQIYQLLDQNIARSFFGSEFAIKEFLQTRGQTPLVREFFRYHVSLLPEALVFIQGVLTIYEAAYTTREAQVEYGHHSDGFVMEPWTSTTSLLDALQTQFELNIKTIHELPIKGSCSPISNYKDLEQLTNDYDILLKFLLRLHCELTKYLLKALVDERNFVQFSGSSQVSMQGLSDRIDMIRTIGIDVMLECGLEDEAFFLAESFEDMETLVKLTLNNAGRDHRITSYMDTFGYSFGNVLFQNLYSSGRLKDLINLRLNHSEYLENFLEQEKLNYLSWILEVENKKFGNASERLFNMAENEVKLNQKDLCASLAKLAYLQTVNEINEVVENEVKKFDSVLDSVDGQQELADSFHRFLTDFGYPSNDFDAASQKIFKQLYPIEENDRIMSTLVKQWICSLLQGKSISMHALLDLWMLQKPAKGPDNCIVLALEKALDHRQNIGEYFQTFLHRFDEINRSKDAQSDTQINEMLKKTNTYQVIEFIFNADDEKTQGVILRPSEVKNVADCMSVYNFLTTDQQFELQEEWAQSQRKLEQIIGSVDAEQIFDSISALAQPITDFDDDIEMF